MKLQKQSIRRLIAALLAVCWIVILFPLVATPQNLSPSDFVLGPQAPIGTSWFDKTQVDRGKFHGRAFPAEPPLQPATPAEPKREDFASDEAFQQAHAAWAATPAIQAWINALDVYIGNNYYDLALALYIAHERTNDPEFLTLARKVADSWWKSPHIGSGTVRTFDTFTHTPRNASLGGLILRALDGRPEMWDWLNAYTRAQFDAWVKSRINDPQLYLGVRDGAFMLQDAAWLAKVLPDTFPLQAGGTATNGAPLRAQYLTDIERAVTDYFGRLQQPDGSWRWDDPYYTDSDGGTLKGIMQPFQVGLLLDALIDVYDVTSNESVRASILKQVTNACRHLYSSGPYSQQHLPALNVKLRGFHYFYHGGTSVNPTKYAKGDLPPDWNPTNPSDVQNQRQAIGLLVAAYGWCFQRTRDPLFKTAGDELWDSAFGPTDGIHNYMAGDAKSYNQNTRWAGSYLVYAGVPPTPTPTPIPSPSPSKTPSPDGTKGPMVVDKDLATWTLGAKGETLKNGSHTGAGIGSVYKYTGNEVYTRGQDSNWYKWIGSWSDIGPTEPGVPATPTPTPTPSPSPSPQPTVTPTPSPTPTVVYETSFPVANSDSERQRVIKDMGLQGWLCQPNPSGKFVICHRGKQ